MVSKSNGAKILTKCSDIAKSLHSIGHVEDAEKVLALALSLHHDDEVQVLLDQIRNKKFDIKQNESMPNHSEIQFHKESLEIKAKNQSENAQYAEMNTNRFKMRTKVLSLEVSVILKKYENDFANSVTPVSHKIECLIKESLDAIDLTDLGEAEKHLLEAERMYNDAITKIPNNMKSKSNNDTIPIVKELVIPKHTPGVREKAELKGNEGDESRCIRIAEAAMKDKDYARAEKFLLKAERLRSTIVAKKLLVVVRDMAMKKESVKTLNEEKSSQNEHCKLASLETAKGPDSTCEGNQKIAEKIIKIAETSFKEKNYERAKNMLEKAEQLFPTAAAKNLLQKIIEIKAKKEASVTLNSILENVFKLLSSAKCMEKNGKLDLSEKYLLEAKKLCPENNDVSEALLRIRNAKVKDPITEEPAQPIAINSEVPESLGSPVETCMSEARTAMALGKFDEAEKIIRDLKENNPNEDMTEILSEIRAARASRSSTEEFNDAEFNYVQERKLIEENQTKQEKEIEKMKEVEAEKHILNAHKAYLEGNLRRAEDLLLKAKELHPQEQIEVLLRDVYAAKNTVTSPKSRLRSGNAWRDQPSATHQEKSVANEEQVDTATMKKPEKDGESNQRTGVHKAGEADGSNIKPGQHMSASAQNKHKRTPAPYSEAHRVDPVPVSAVEAQTYIQKAQEAFTKKHYDEAEICILKSHELSPSNEATGLLEKIRAAKREVSDKKDKHLQGNANDNKTNTHRNEFKTIEEFKREEAESCINVAQTVLSSGVLVGAERLLHKAERIFPTEQAEGLLEETAVKKTKNNTKDNYCDPSTLSASNRAMVNDVNTLINVAFEYIGSKKLYEAKHFFETAYKLSPGDYTADLLDQIKTKIEHEEEFSMPVRKGKKHNKGKDKKIDAEYFVEEGEKALNTGKTGYAEANLIVAGSLRQNKRIDELLEKIRKSTNAKPVGRLNDFKSAEYIRIGRNAIDIENFILAEHFLVKAQALSPSETTKILLKKVMEVKNLVYESKKPIWKKVANFMWL